MDRKSLTLIAIGIGLIVAGAGVYAQPTLDEYEPVEKDGPDTLNISETPVENSNFTTGGVNITEMDEDVYIPEDRWWSVTSTDPQFEEEYVVTEKPPATALSEGNANNMTGYLVISGFMLVVSGLLREYEK